MVGCVKGMFTHRVIIFLAIFEIFPSPLFKKQQERGDERRFFRERGNLFFSNHTVVYLPTFQRFQSFLFQRVDLPGARTGGLPPIGGSPSCGARIFPKKRKKKKEKKEKEEKKEEKRKEEEKTFFSVWY